MAHTHTETCYDHAEHTHADHEDHCDTAEHTHVEECCTAS